MSAQAAKHPFIVNVKARHCAAGKATDPYNCIVAKAVAEQMGGEDHVKRVRVGVRTTRVVFVGHNGEDGQQIRYTTPDDLKKLLEDFDTTGTRMAPGEYELQPLRYSDTNEYKRQKQREYAAPGYIAESVPQRRPATRA